MQLQLHDTGENKNANILCIMPSTKYIYFTKQYYVLKLKTKDSHMRIIKWFARAQCCIVTINASNIYNATNNKSFCRIFLQSDTRQPIPSLILDKAEGNVVKRRQKIVQVKSVCFIVSSTVEVRKRISTV